jgi:hypothetical protein
MTVFGADILGFNDLDLLQIVGGRAHNTFNVLDTPNAFRLGIGQETFTSIFTGPSGDFVNVRGTHSEFLEIFNQANNSVTIGNNGNLDNIQGPVEIKNINNANPGSFTSLLVNALNDSSFENVTMSVDSFGNGTIHGLAPADIDYVTSDVSTVAVLGGSHGSLFTVQDTSPSTAFRATEIDPGLGSNTINVLGTTGPLFIASQGARDLVSVGGAFGAAGTLTHIHGEVQVSNDGGQLTRLNVNASADNFNHIVTLQATAFEGQIFGLSQAPITYFADSISSINISGGSGRNANDQFFVQGTAGAPQGVEINGGSGNDFFNIGSASNSLDAIRSGPLLLEAGVGGHNTLFVQDQGSALGHSYQTPPNEIFRSGGGTPPVTILFNNHFQNVQLFPNGSHGPQAQDLALTQRVRVGQLAHLTGTLVDDDPTQVLSLTVDWGDGSDPETSTPDRDSFDVTHSYASPGRYFVHVTWSDSDGVSNSRDLLIRVKPDRVGPDAGPDAFDALDAVFALLAARKDRPGQE